MRRGRSSSSTNRSPTTRTPSATAPAARAPARRWARLGFSCDPSVRSVCGRRTRAPCSIRRICRRFPRRRYRAKMPIASRGWLRAAARCASGCRSTGTARPTWNPPTSSARFAAARSPTRSSSSAATSCVITWEALRLMKKLGIQPRRTVRLVLWTNEENGTRGAAAYADKYASTAMNHVFALEADSGVFEPARFGFSGSLAARNVIRDITSLLSPLNLAETISGGGGADIDPIAQAGRAPTMAYMGDPTRYFTIHHTPADTVERIAPEEVAKGAAAIAVVTYVIAEMPDRLPK
ncbi:MAG: hypothetical protein DMF88_13265 [Acidobacteria bacterium]|nr:MAG: hypothetical protein DMF88_13265 [Acidobacteriota bacterium]